MRMGVGLGPFYVSGLIGGRRRRYRSRHGPRGLPWLVWLVIWPVWLEYLLLKWMLWMPAVWLWRTWRSRTRPVTVRQHS